MKLYYTITFSQANKMEVDGYYFDAITFTAKDGARYTLDVNGDHDYSVIHRDEQCTVTGRVKGDCNDIRALAPMEEEDFTKIEYTAVHALLAGADTTDMEFVLCGFDGEEILDYVAYDVQIQLNGCAELIFKKEADSVGNVLTNFEWKYQGPVSMVRGTGYQGKGVSRTMFLTPRSRRGINFVEKRTKKN